MTPRSVVLIFLMLTNILAEVQINYGNFVAYSKEKTDLQHRTVVKAGDVGSYGIFEIGCDDTLAESVLSKDNILIRDRAIIKGNVMSGGIVTSLTGVIIQGTKLEKTTISMPVLPTFSVVPGIQNVSVPSDGAYILYPGNYGDFQAWHRSSITIKPGVYTFNRFLVESDVKIVLDAGNTNQININVKDLLRIGDRIIMTFVSGVVCPYSISYYSEQTAPLTLGYDNQVYGVVTAPNAEVRLLSRSKLFGGLFGRQVIVESEGFLCKPPVLNNLSHSEMVMGPAFNPARLSYNIVIPTTINTLSVYPIGRSGQIITVDGQAPGSLINLNGPQQRITVLMSDPKYCGYTEYVLSVNRSDQYQIFVNASSPCAPELEDGKSWATAYKDLQKALDSAAVQGKEVWVSEGEYKPTKRTNPTDPRSVSFLISSGTKVIGGFLGTETSRCPDGDNIKTILSGDILGNDTAITTWPPDSIKMNLLSDNAYHVITLNSPVPTDMVYIENLTIKDGNDSIGAGVLNKNCSPVIKSCIFEHNVATSSGAGFYDGGNSSFEDCLFKENLSLTGSGSGLYLAGMSDTTTIIGTIFDGNVCRDTNTGRGGALHNVGANVVVKTSVFTRNFSAGNGGAIASSGGSISISNCTIAYNTALKDGSGMASYATAVVDICNSIFWDPCAVKELQGSGYTVSHSDIRGSYPGLFNIDAEPLFEDAANPEGPDGVYGTSDDGLKLTEGSPCKETGDNDRGSEYDIRLIPRPYSEIICMGAYEYEEYSQRQVTAGPLGYLSKTGEFESVSPVPIIDYIYNYKDAGVQAHSNNALVLQVAIPKNAYTNKTDQFVVTVRGINNSGQPLSGSVGVQIPVKRVSALGNSYYYQSKTLDWGKSILLCEDPELQNWNDSAYIIYTKGDVSYEVSKTYFRK